MQHYMTSFYRDNYDYVLKIKTKYHEISERMKKIEWKNEQTQEGGALDHQKWCCSRRTGVVGRAYEVAAARVRDFEEEDDE